MGRPIGSGIDRMPATDDALIPRHAAGQVATALADMPVVTVSGPRQCGKTTLVRGFAVGGRRCISLASPYSASVLS